MIRRLLCLMRIHRWWYMIGPSPDPYFPGVLDRSCPCGKCQRYIWGNKNWINTKEALELPTKEWMKK